MAVCWTRWIKSPKPTLLKKSAVNIENMKGFTIKCMAKSNSRKTRGWLVPIAALKNVVSHFVFMGYKTFNEKHLCFPLTSVIVFKVVRVNQNKLLAVVYNDTVDHNALA